MSETRPCDVPVDLEYHHPIPAEIKAFSIISDPDASHVLILEGGKCIGYARTDEYAYLFAAAWEMRKALEAQQSLDRHYATCEECDAYEHICEQASEMEQEVAILRNNALRKARGEKRTIYLQV